MSFRTVLKCISKNRTLVVLLLSLSFAAGSLIEYSPIFTSFLPAKVVPREILVDMFFVFAKCVFFLAEKGWLYRSKNVPPFFPVSLARTLISL